MTHNYDAQLEGELTLRVGDRIQGGNVLGRCQRIICKYICCFGSLWLCLFVLLVARHSDDERLRKHVRIWLPQRQSGVTKEVLVSAFDIIFHLTKTMNTCTSVLFVAIIVSVMHFCPAVMGTEKRGSGSRSFPEQRNDCLQYGIFPLNYVSAPEDSGAAQTPNGKGGE